MFFPKLFKWVKNHGKSILTIISIMVAIIGGIQTIRANRWEKEALKLDGKLEEQKADQDKLYTEAMTARVNRNAERVVARKWREKLEAQIDKFKHESEIAKKALVAEKAKTTLLPPSELVMQIAKRIGDELTLTGDRLYLFTRTGTERTLDRFKDGEFYLSEYYKFEGVLADHKKEIDSFNTSITECESDVATNLTGWNDCRETLATALAGRAADKKVARANVWRGRKQGAFWTIVIGGVLKIFGVW